MIHLTLGQQTAQYQNLCSSGGQAFSQEFPAYRIIKKTRNECFLFFTSGGVIAKTHYLPVGDKGAEIIKKVDKALISLAPSFFACGCSVVLERMK